METSTDSMDETSTDNTPRLASQPPISATSSPIPTGHLLERVRHSVEQLGGIHNFTPKKIMESINNSSNNNDNTPVSLGEVMNLMPFAYSALLCNRTKAKVSPESSSSSSSPPSPLLFLEANRIARLGDKFTKSSNGLDKATARPMEAVMGGGGGGGDRDKDARRFYRHLRNKRRILREMARNSVLVDEPKTEAEAAAKKKATDEYYFMRSVYLEMSRLFRETPYSVPRPRVKNNNDDDVSRRLAGVLSLKKGHAAPPDATRVWSGVRSVSRRPVAAAEEVERERERGGRGGPIRRGRRQLDVNNVLDDLRDLTL